MTDPENFVGYADRGAGALLPCPFCGSENPSMKRFDAVWCGSCLAEMPEHDFDVPNAITRWNTRLTSRPSVPDDVVEALGPFAREADAQERVTSFRDGDCIIPRTKITIGQLRRARAVLASLKEGEGL